MEVPSTFGERLLMARRRAGLGQSELGATVGLTSHTISRLERGRTTQISLEALRRISQVLAVSVDWLLGAGMERLDESTEDIIEEPVSTPHV